MSLRGISHIALSVPDLAAARRFWTEVMNFEVTTDMPGLCFVVDRPARIGLGLTDHGGAVQGEFDEKRGGLDHLALAVADASTLDAWQRRLVEHDVPHSPVTDDGGLHLNLRAPGNIAIELYVMDDATAAAFGLADPSEGVALS